MSRSFGWLWSGIGVLLALALFAGCASQSQMSGADPRVTYDAALKKLENEKWADAQLLLQRVSLSAPGSSYIDSVQYYLAMSFFGNGDYHLAIAEFRRLANSFPRSELLDDAQYMVGKSYFLAAPGNVGLDQTDNESAIRELQAFLEEHPRSPLLVEATQLLSTAIEKRVRKQFQSGRQYFRMGNGESARLYLTDIITEYPESRYTPEALYLLARVDAKEGKLEDARDKLNNLINAFPDSKLTKRAAQMKLKIEKSIAEAAADTAAAAQLNGGKSE